MSNVLSLLTFGGIKTDFIKLMPKICCGKKLVVKEYVSDGSKFPFCREELLKFMVLNHQEKLLLLFTLLRKLKNAEV